MRISLLKRNVAANFLGRGFAAVLFLIAIPFYIRFLGIEAYGIIGFFTSLTALATIFDLGLTTTANRELARLSGASGEAQTARDLTRSLEFISWGSALALGAAAAFAADPIAHDWLRVENLDPEEVARAVMVMAVALLIQLPYGFYSGCLMGLQRQVLLNLVNSAGALVQVTGAIAVLWLISPSLTAFFLWQAIARGLHAAILGFLVWRSLPSSQARPRFSLREVHKVWRFAAGMTATSIVGLLFAQMDNILLSRLLPLSQFGYYAFARAVTLGLLIFATPVFTAVFPHFSQLIAADREEDLEQRYHRATQAVVVALIPAAAVLALFAPEILWAWTGDVETTANSALLVALLAVAMAAHGVLHVPYALLLAAGRMSFIFFANSFALIFLFASILYLTNLHGATGAAWAWIATNFGAFVIIPVVMHRRLLRGLLAKWFLVDVLPPALAACAIALVARWLLPPLEDRVTIVLVLIVVFGTTALGTLAVVPWMRTLVLERIVVVTRKTQT